MANIKSAKKRILVIDKKTARNKAIKSKVKTYIKKVDALIAAGDKAASKGVYHKNTAARKISRLALAVNKIA
ncbi:MAG: 30S ribosomal protein S20 [Lachnospiraceae bacterium]|nr:30S ribosomal protein S20 [Lachnospiraceae bacterium]